MCGCSKNSVVVQSNTFANKSIQEEVDTNCDTSLESLNILREVLVLKKTPENSSFINRQLGLIDTMINHRKFCMYKIEVI